MGRRNWTNPHASCVAIVRTTGLVRPEGESPKSLKCLNFDAKYSNSLKVNVNPIDLLHIRIIIFILLMEEMPNNHRLDV